MSLWGSIGEPDMSVKTTMIRDGAGTAGISIGVAGKIFGFSASMVSDQIGTSGISRGGYACDIPIVVDIDVISRRCFRQTRHAQNIAGDGDEEAGT
jgi:hypothetical protein